jgi:hypothetical protein
MPLNIVGRGLSSSSFTPNGCSEESAITAEDKKAQSNENERRCIVSDPVLDVGLVGRVVLLLWYSSREQTRQAAKSTGKCQCRSLLTNDRILAVAQLL